MSEFDNFRSLRFVRGLSRLEMAVVAYRRATQALADDEAAGRIGRPQAMARYRHLRAAFNQRRQQIELSAFLARAGVVPTADRKASASTETSLQTEAA